MTVEVLRKEIAKQLRNICPHIPALEFDRYVDRLAHVEHSYALADNLESLIPVRQARHD